MLTKWSLLAGLLVLFYGCTQAPSDQPAITIATAANMQFAMEALSAQFTAETGIECQLVVSSSGKLTAQIKEGAPYDLLVAANMKYPQEIDKAGLAQEPPVVYAYGKLVLWTMRKGLKANLSQLRDENIQQIAIANPKTAPYGQAALEVLQQLGIEKMVQGRLVYGESIAQTNQFILTQSADLGFTAMSVVLSPLMKNQGHWIAIEENLYQPIAQGVVLLQTTESKTEWVHKFYTFLNSESAQEILHNFGYTTVAK